MSARLAEIARQTVSICETGSYLLLPGAPPVEIAQEVAAAVEGTRHYRPDDRLEWTNAQVETQIEVTRESTLEAARRMGPEAATLVFASARNPGGGFLGGAKAQEESLARASALYPCLLAAPDFYAFHRAHRDTRYSDRVIYSPKVPVFRDDRGALLEQPYLTSFLTSAAPNHGAVARNQPELLDTIPEMLRSRARRVLEVAAAHGHRDLVLGAWGCGAFRNDPEPVAEAFALGLREVPVFERVVFAIYDRLPFTPVYEAFRKVLLVGDEDRRG